VFLGEYGLVQAVAAVHSGNSVDSRSIDAVSSRLSAVERVVAKISDRMDSVAQIASSSGTPNVSCDPVFVNIDSNPGNMWFYVRTGRI
jgi:hypothetical protein